MAEREKDVVFVRRLARYEGVPRHGRDGSSCTGCLMARRKQSESLLASYMCTMSYAPTIMERKCVYCSVQDFVVEKSRKQR
mmetsp:Transcript_26317/g.47536  ORF Transcript_26317/g.47536 Transcript_26317/m.47536 type:complete len:81 (-) Transcript_26317:814-1056(-)